MKHLIKCKKKREELFDKTNTKVNLYQMRIEVTTG